MSTRKVGIIGTGFMAGVHAAAWTSVGHTPAAILGRTADSAARLAAEFGAAPFTDLDAFMNAVDIVDICTPTHLHAEFALAAASARKPTLCEKPLSLSVEEGRRVVDAFKSAGIPLQVGHILRFTAEYVVARNQVAAGAIGHPAVVRLSRLSFAPRREGGSWFEDEKKSGGIPFDLMIHDLDYARWVAGDVASVYAKSAFNSLGHVVAVLKHTSGTVSHIESSWSLPAPEFKTSFEIAGAAGILSFASEDTTTLKVRLHEEPSAGNTGLGDTELAANPFEAEMRSFLNVLDGTADPVLTSGDALAAVQLAAAVIASARTGKPVDLTPIREVR
jgi:predicted dehydrogenase